MKLNKKAGFTLIELLTALVILAGSTIIISRIWSGNRQRVGKIGDYHHISRLMERKITELEFEWRKKNFNSIPRQAKGEFKEEKHFSWSVKTQPINLLESQQMLNLVTQANNDMAQQIMGAIQKLLSSSILEIKLTVHFNKKQKKTSYSLSTYIVDYTQKPTLN